MNIPKDIKIAIFDFDDTLAVHINKNYSKTRTNEYFKQAYLNPESFYDSIEKCIAPDNMKNLIHYLRTKNVKLYCLSGMRSSLHFKAKEYFTHKHYGNDIEFLSCRNQEIKMDVISILKDVNNCNYQNILFVDDIENNLKLANSLGIVSILANDVENLKIPKGEKHDS